MAVRGKRKVRKECFDIESEMPCAEAVLHACATGRSERQLVGVLDAARGGTFREMPTVGAEERRMSELVLAVLASSRGSPRVRAAVRGRNQEAAATTSFGNSNGLQRSIKCFTGNLQEQGWFRRRTERPDRSPSTGGPNGYVPFTS